MSSREDFFFKFIVIIGRLWSTKRAQWTKSYCADRYLDIRRNTELHSRPLWCNRKKPWMGSGLLRLTVFCSSCSELCSLVPSSLPAGAEHGLSKIAASTEPQEEPKLCSGTVEQHKRCSCSLRTPLHSLSPSYTSAGTKGARRSFLPAKH